MLGFVKPMYQMERSDKEEEEEEERTPLVVDESTQRRKVVVEPLLLTYMLAGAPMEALQLQYMYQKIARDMGIDLHNMTGNNND